MAIPPKEDDSGPTPGSSAVMSSLWPKAGASIAVIRDQSVLLIKRGKPPLTGAWSLPGGHIEPGETAAEAALRELREETGVVAELVGLIDIHDVIRRDSAGRLEAHYLLAVFGARWRSGSAVAASDARMARFVPIQALATYDITAGTETFAEQALARVGGSGGG